MTKLVLILAFHILFFTLVFSQVNYEPASSSVYSFLERMSGKGIIQLNEEIMPFSRMYIAGKLQTLLQKVEVRSQKSVGKKSKEIHQSSIAYRQAGIINHHSSVSNIEREELEFYIREYASELRRLGFDITEYEVESKLIDLKSDQFGFDKFNRFRLFSFDSKDFGIFVDPVLKYENHNHNNGSWWSYSNGIKLHGFLGNNIGFDLQFYDNHPRGEVLEPFNKFTPETGYEFRVGGKGDGFDYDRLNANLNFSWDYVTLSISKDFNYYGSGEDGKLILSDKAPSFPNLKLEVYPTDWLKFSYIHGSLHSQVLDSSTFRYNPYRNHISTVEKYYVTHMLSVTPFKSFNISIGESVIYSDKFEPIYLVPIAFFRFADHYLTDPDENAGNAQLFGSFWYKNYWLRTKIYGSIFIDELTTYEKDYPEAVGYNIGFKTIDPLISDSELVLEYTRINPFVYFHADSVQTYWNYGYEMGHWMGSNADAIYASFTKKILRGLSTILNYRYIRKGSEEDFEEPRYQDNQKFLWGDKTFYSYYGIRLNYEIIHSLNADFTYNYIKTKHNNLNSETTSISTFSLQYGL